MSDRYYTVHDEYREKHIQVPKVFFTNPKYNKMSTDAKMAWAILRDRHNLSKRNRWIEEGTGRIYFIYTNPQLADILNCSLPKVVTIKKQLKAALLLDDKRIGQGMPNRLYLLRPEVSDSDIYLIDDMEKEPIKSVEPPQDQKLKNLTSLEPQEKLKNLTSRNQNSLHLEVKKFNPSNIDSSDTDLSNTDVKENLSIQDKIQELNIPVLIMKMLLEKTERLILLNINLSDIELMYQTNKDKLDAAAFAHVVSDCLDVDRIEKSFKGLLHISMKTYLENKNKKVEVGQATPKRTVPDYIKESSYKATDSEKLNFDMPKQDEVMARKERYELLMNLKNEYGRELTPEEQSFIFVYELENEPEVG